MGHGCAQRTWSRVAGTVCMIWTMSPFAPGQHDHVVMAAGEVPSQLRCVGDLPGALLAALFHALSLEQNILSRCCKSRLSALCIYMYGGKRPDPSPGEPNVAEA